MSRNPCLIVILLAFVLQGCVDDYAGAAPDESPAAVAANPDAPYQARLMQQYWTFAPDVVHYAHHGELLALRDNPGQVRVIAIPTWPNVRPQRVGASSTVRITRLQEAAESKAGGWVNLDVVVEPTGKLKKGDLFRYDITWDQARVPYLHEQGGMRRLLSYSSRMFPDHPRTQFVFAIPSSSQQVAKTDFQPFREIPARDWTLYEYDTTNAAVATIHLSFSFAGTPAGAPPTPGDVFRALPR